MYITGRGPRAFATARRRIPDDGRLVGNMAADVDSVNAVRGAAPAIQMRLDSLTTGDYDQDVLLREAYILAQTAPDGVCEMLSVVDQYYRRGKIRAAEYRQLKSYLGPLLVDGLVDTRVTRPPPQRPDLAPADQITEPVASTADGAAAAQSQSACAVSGTRGAASGERRLAVGDTLRGRYRVAGIVGQGGMGTIFEVVDQYLTDIGAVNRRLAVKMLHTEVTQRPELLRELLAEFLNLRALSHPNIVRVHDFDRDGDTAFFTMELLNGSALGLVMSEYDGTPLGTAHARAIVHETGMALAHAHSRGIVHGDVNPQNIFLTSDGETRVLDFGASRRLKAGASIAEAPAARPLLVATLRYASCEVLEGHTPDASDDLFALACVAYALLSGKHPFANRTAIQARTAGLNIARPRGLSGRQWQALRAGLDLRRERRPSDVGRWVCELNAGATLQPLPMLSELLTVPPDRPRIALVAGLAAALTLLAAGGLWVAHQQEPLQQVAAHGQDAAAAALRTARTSFVHTWNQALRSAVIGNDADDAAGIARPTTVRAAAARTTVGASARAALLDPLL